MLTQALNSASREAHVKDCRLGLLCPQVLHQVMGLALSLPSPEAWLPSPTHWGQPLQTQRTPPATQKETQTKSMTHTLTQALNLATRSWPQLWLIRFAMPFGPTQTLGETLRILSPEALQPSSTHWAIRHQGYLKNTKGLTRDPQRNHGICNSREDSEQENSACPPEPPPPLQRPAATNHRV